MKVIYNWIGDDILILNLDTGYEAPMEGAQLEWIEQVLVNSKAKIKMAQYHNPIYTPCEVDGDDATVKQKGLKHWVPLFDKYNMTLVFENHTHAFKRSKPIKDGKVDKHGTVYLGEGAWGDVQDPSECKLIDSHLFERFQNSPNIWQVKIDVTNGISCTAYNHMGGLLDSFYIDLKE